MADANLFLFFVVIPCPNLNLLKEVRHKIFFHKFKKQVEL